MIEKLPFTECHSGGGEHMVDILKLEPVQPFQMQHKINELIDAVKELQKHEEQHLDLLTQLNEMRLQKEPTDPYAEQRKWVGKLCWFWDNQEEYKFVGILGEVSDNGTYFQKDGIVSYLNCEPVSPEDDIIYKKD